MGELIQEPEPCSVSDLKPGMTFMIPKEPYERVFCTTIGDDTERGALNVSCVVLAMEQSDNSKVLCVGALVSIPRTTIVQKLEMIHNSLYKRV